MLWTPTHDGSIEGIVKVLLVVGFSNSISELDVFTEVGDCDNFADDTDVTDDFVSCKRDDDDEGNHGIDDKDNCNDDETGDKSDDNDDDNKDDDEDDDNDDEIGGNDEVVELELQGELPFLSERIAANNITK